MAGDEPPRNRKRIARPRTDESGRTRACPSEVRRASGADKICPPTGHCPSFRGRIVNEKSFLLVYDRHAGELLECQEFSGTEREQALQEPFARERRYRTDPNIEVVVVTAASREVLEHTHGRYFKTIEELADLA